MAVRMLLIFCFVVSFACNPNNQTVGPITPSQSANARLENARVGYSLRYPQDWQVRGQITATEFAQSAQCESVEVVDLQPPADAGPSAVILHSFVQICDKSLVDGATLEGFLRQTYGDSFAARFQSTDRHGVRAYESRNEAGNVTLFSQTKEYRIQLVTAVVADAAKQPIRRAEVDAILETFVVQQR